MHSRILLRTSLALFTAFLFQLHSATPDVSGKWKWTFHRNNGEPLDVQMIVKQQDQKVTGKISAADREVEIQKGKISEDGELTFYINHEQDGNTLKVNFHGKVEGDKITGKTEYTNSEGEQRSIDWDAKRDKVRNVAGKWKSVFKRQDGSDMESTLTLKQDGEKLGGANDFNGNETEIRDGKLQGDQITFKIVRERDGRTVTSTYTGKVEGTRIKGHIESDWTGEMRRLDWEANKEK